MNGNPVKFPQGPVGFGGQLVYPVGFQGPPGKFGKWAHGPPRNQTQGPSVADLCTQANQLLEQAKKMQEATAKKGGNKSVTVVTPEEEAATTTRECQVCGMGIRSPKLRLCPNKACRGVVHPPPAPKSNAKDSPEAPPKKEDAPAPKEAQGKQELDAIDKLFVDHAPLQMKKTALDVLESMKLPTLPQELKAQEYRANLKQKPPAQAQPPSSEEDQKSVLRFPK